MNLHEVWFMGRELGMGPSSGSSGMPDVSDSDRIVYIQEGLAELRAVSKCIEGNDVLTYFIEMAMMQAADRAREIGPRK